MRDLTQDEIDNSPEWADKYKVIGEALFFVNKKHQCQLIISKNHSRMHDLFFDYKECQLIPRKITTFNLNKLIDDNLANNSTNTYRVNNRLYLRFFSKSGFLEKSDSVKIAKYFKLTPGDLK